MTTTATNNTNSNMADVPLFVAFELRGYPETMLGKTVYLLNS
jgi:hypothetical protein